MQVFDKIKIFKLKELKGLFVSRELIYKSIKFCLVEKEFDLNINGFRFEITLTNSEVWRKKV